MPGYVFDGEGCGGEEAGGGIAGDNTFGMLERLDEVIAELDRALKTAVEERGGVYLDLRALVMDGNGNLQPRFAAADGLHLNAAGYAVWVGLISKVL